ncbi:MAG TPA: hypothetical protein VFR03_02945 [Thermoanaerobaculia bacterium]|nr:hypothetical protein [Thermoanaerobaculia bacterium]
MTSRRRASLSYLLLVCLLAVAPLRAQEQEPVQTPPPDQGPATAAPPAPAPTPPAPVPQTPTVPEPSSAGGGTEGETLPPKPTGQFLPRLDVYFPEGDLDLRINRLINKTFFEGQVKYNFVNGDITAFLRYRYYGLKRTTQLTVFDSISFDRIDQDVTADFDRVRGTLLLMEWPHNYNNRTFFLTEIDRISSNRGPAEGGGRFLVRRDQSNTFVRLGYQLGTPDEGRSSAIAGETRARTERLFSAFREFGPGEATLTSALSYGFPYGPGDFNYLKFEFEALKRFDVSRRTFLVGRLRGGTFLHVAKADPSTLPPDPDGIDFYAVPRSEAFNIDGRENLKGVRDRTRGTDALFTTWEYFFPWFLETKHRALRLDWDNWYWILYAGYGTVGLSHSIYKEFSSYYPDAGIGFESSFRLRKYRFFLSGIVAQALRGNSGLEARISVKSYR